MPPVIDLSPSEHTALEADERAALDR